MGCADFYLNIYIDESLSLCVNEKLNSYDEYNVFNHIKSQNKIEIEGYFDNFLIINKILFSVLSSFNDKEKIKLEAIKFENNRRVANAPLREIRYKEFY